MHAGLRGNGSLVNLVFLVVLALGAWSYFAMPRAQYPEVRLNWVAVATVWPGASGEDVERYLTLPLESALRQVPGVQYVAATSRDHVSALVIRFREASAGDMTARVQELARVIQSASGAFPAEVQHPQVLELTTSSLFHTAMITLKGAAPDGGLCALAETVRQDLEAMEGVGRVWAYGLRKPELSVEFDPKAMDAEGALLEGLVETLKRQARGYPAGGLNLDGQHYSVRVLGLGSNPDWMLDLPVPTAEGGSVALERVASVGYGLSQPRERVTQNGEPAILLTVMKQEQANTLALMDEIRAYVAGKNQLLGREALLIADDQTESMRHSVRAMEWNAVLGLILVLAIAWLALGRRMALLVSIGVPFALAAMFLALHLSGQTLNVSVLLGVAIVLGIPLDDAVVVAEAISMRLNRGMDRMSALADALQEVRMPVSASVLATVAAFAPLMFLDGIMGQFMFVVPLTVILTLLASLVASLWILPSHVAGGLWSRAGAATPDPWRARVQHRLRHVYGRALARAFRHPGPMAFMFLAVFAVAGLALQQGWVGIQWFTSDPLRVFNVNVVMPPSSGLETTLKTTQEVERRLRESGQPGEVQSAVSVAGLQFTPNELLTGDNVGQVTLSLAPDGPGMRSVSAFVAAARASVLAVPGAEKVAFQVLSADLPSLSDVNLRLAGQDQARVLAALADFKERLETLPGLTDLRIDTVIGKPRLTLRLNHAVAARHDVDPYALAGYIRLHLDGAAVAQVADGETLIDVVVRGKPMDAQAIQDWLNKPVLLPTGQRLVAGELFSLEFEPAAGQLRRINYQPSVAIQAELAHGAWSAREARAEVMATWDGIRAFHPGVELVFGGPLDDVQDSLADIAWLFVIGLVAMYLLLALQFRGAGLPLLVMATAPMAFAGALLGLMIMGQPLTLYTLYGGIALGGVAVNASIMLVSAAQDRRLAGYSPIHAAFYAARRRLIPILITTLSIIAGLSALALGLAGESVLWGPLAATLVWGLALATPLTLFATPLLYGHGLRTSRDRALG